MIEPLELRRLMAGAPGPLFDWSMPDTFGTARADLRDDLGFPIIPNTPGYVRPTPVVVNGASVATFPVLLNATATDLGAPVIQYQWQITGGGVSQTLTSSAVTQTNLPEGRYSVRLSANAADGIVRQITRRINVVNHLIVAIGDSYSSGEGNPARDVQTNFLGFISQDARWATGGNSTETQLNASAHRSPYAGSVQAASQLENSDSKSSVTFVFLSESGATIEQDVMGLTPRTDGQPTQLQRLRDLAGNRRVDALAMSVGGNDVGFASIVSDLVLDEPSDSDYPQELADLWSSFSAKAAHLTNDLYPALASTLASTADSLDIGAVYLTEYVDPGYNNQGATADKVADDILSGREVDNFELTQARANVIQPLFSLMQTAAQQSGWHYVGGISAAFQTHGYANQPWSWIRTASQSVEKQGPFSNKNLITPLDKANTTGTVHPNEAGQQVYATRLLQEWQNYTVPFNNPAVVVGRNVFYNNSKFDGFDPAANALDDASIAPDKTPLLPGGSSSIANYTNYSKGINGVMIDVDGIRYLPALAPSDFQFAYSSTANPNWTPVAQPVSIFVRAGAGMEGTDRISFTWPDGVIRNGWLRITVDPTVTTALALPDLFYFGNLMGDSRVTPMNVDANDYFSTRNFLRTYDSPAPITWSEDFNRDGVTDGQDLQIVRANSGNSLSAVSLVTAAPQKTATTLPTRFPRTLIRGLSWKRA